MIISSSTASSTVPASPETLPASGGPDAGAGGAFASLLPPENDCQARASSDGGKAESEDDTDDDGKPDDAEPVLAEQTNLAALLYALPAISVPPPAGTANATESLRGQDQPLSGTGERPEGTANAGLLANITLPPATGGGTEADSFQGQLDGELGGNAEKAARDVPKAPSDAPDASQPAITDGQTTSLTGSKGPAWKFGLAPAATARDSATPAAPDSTGEHRPIPAHAEAAKIAAPSSPAVADAKTTPAISALTQGTPGSKNHVSLISEMPANPDDSLVPEQKWLGKSARGTGGAKPVRDMIEASAIHPNSNPDARSLRSATASLTAPEGVSGKALSGRAQGDAQDQAAGGRSDANQAGAETFSLPNGSAPTLIGQRSDAAAKIAESKPMSTAAVIEELGHGLERIQQQGNNRVDLRLSLEGGGEVSIQLQVRDGAVHASFLTESTQLREALQQGWSQLAGRSEHVGLSLAEPVFKTPETGSTSTGQQDFREHRQEARQQQNDRTPTFYGTPHPTRRHSAPTAPTRPATSSGLNAYA